MRLFLTLTGDVFDETNAAFDFDSDGHVMRPKTAQLLAQVFAHEMKLVKTETFGSPIIDDIHIVMQWETDGNIVEYYYEQYWDITELSITGDVSAVTSAIVRCFEAHFGRKFSHFVEIDGDKCSLVIEQ